MVRTILYTCLRSSGLAVFEARRIYKVGERMAPQVSDACCGVFRAEGTE